MQKVSDNRLAGLDTLRACAIVWVVLFHLQGVLPAVLEPIASMGWLGVDLFFVLSGYLLGLQLLQRVLAGERQAVLEFYRRRAYRILPAYLVVVGLYLLVPQWREDANLPAAWKLLTFTANLAMNYPVERAFSHVWSLCIEEHFYLALPFAVLGLARIRNARIVMTTFAGLLLAGVAVRWGIFHHIMVAMPEDDRWIGMMKRIYYPTYSRLDGLLGGLALATIRVARHGWWERVAGHGTLVLCAGLLTLAGGMATFHFEYPSADAPVGLVAGFPLVALGFALCVAAAACRGGLLTRRMPGSNRLATLAFSLYLTHKPVAHVDRLLMPWLQGNLSWSAACVYAVTCVAVAAALYLAVERPFLLLRERRVDSPRVDVEARLEPAL